MQSINGIKDSLREEVEGLDGGYATVARAAKKTTQFIHKVLQHDYSPRLSTLESIREAVDVAKTLQAKRLRQLSA